MNYNGGNWENRILALIGGIGFSLCGLVFARPKTAQAEAYAT